MHNKPARQNYGDDSLAAWKSGLVRRNFNQDFPVAVTGFLGRMFLPMDEPEALMAAANDSSYDKAVDDYIRKHPARVNYRVTGSPGPDCRH